MTWRRILAALLVLALAAAGVFAWKIGPRNAVGMLLYDQRREGSLQVGDLAPDVALERLEGGSVRLSQYVGGRPLVLIFGGFTCPPFRRSVERLEEIAAEHAERARFLTIYIKEAHSTDEWPMDENDSEGVCYVRPVTLEQRLAVARDFAARHSYALPLVVDRMEDAADEIYAGWPERLYVIGADGRIAYKGETGPFGFEPDEVDAWLDARR
jgi:peroxiredoxin